MKRRHRILKFFLIAACVIIALLTLMAAYGGIVNPDKTAIPAIMAMTFPFWALLCGVMAVILLLFRSRTAFIPAAALLLSAGPINSLCPLNIFKPKATEEEKATEFSLLSYNIYGFSDFLNPDTTTNRPLSYYKDRMAQGHLNPQATYMIQSGADILCIQERSVSTPYPRYYISKSQCDSIDSIYPNQTGYLESILTAFPMKKIKLRQPPESWAEFTGAELDVHGNKLLVINVHLQSIGLNSDDKVLYEELTNGEKVEDIGAVKHQLLGKLNHAFKRRAMQARLLREQIDSLNYENVIVSGDFNDIPDCYAMRVISGDDFRSAFAECARGPMITYHANRFYFHIDHVLYRGRLKPISFTRGNIPNSDHYPVEVHFVWTDKSTY